VHIRFGLLGPIAVGSDDGLTQIKGSHVRGMLASLSLRANLMVPHTDITLDLWCEAPSSAADNLRKFAMRLRRQLGALSGPLEGRLLTLRGGGYGLQVGADELDLHQFRERWSRGRGELLAGEFHSAATHLAKAIRLWRGHAGLDVPSDGLLAKRLDRLNQELLLAREDLAAARIGLGDSIAVIDALETHVKVCPTRERAVQLLLLAYYRSGDVSAALATYRGARYRLVEELGVEPGEPLRQLHQAALDRDDATLYDNRLLARASSTLRPVVLT
jgi:DNA-binding SARP family transcriptional activator